MPERPPSVLVVDDDDLVRNEFVSKPFRSSELVGYVWELLQRSIPEPQFDWPRRQEQQMISAAKVARLRHRRGGDSAKTPASAGHNADDPTGS